VLGDSSNADVKERTSPSKKDSSMDNIMTKLFSGLDDDNDLGMRNVSGWVGLFLQPNSHFWSGLYLLCFRSHSFIIPEWPLTHYWWLFWDFHFDVYYSDAQFLVHFEQVYDSFVNKTRICRPRPGCLRPRL